MGDSCDVLPKSDIELAVRNVLKTSDFSIQDYSILQANSETTGVLATHSRVTLSVDVGNVRRRLQLFIKSYPREDVNKDFAREFAAFKKEVGFYMQILEELIPFGVPLPYAACYHGRSDDVNDFVVLEDLVEGGYKLADRRSGLDVDHCTLIVRGLARLHASSVALEKRRKEPLNEIFQFLFYTFFNGDTRGNKAEAIFQQNIDAFKKIVTLIPQYRNSLQEVLTKLDGAYDKACSLQKPSEAFNVVCHGDIWINNILYKYNNEQRPTDVKLVDLQLAAYGPPTLDLLVLLYTSTTRSFRKHHLHQLLKDYHECFTTTLSHLGTSMPGFTLQTLQEDFQNRRLLGMTYAMQYLPYCLLEQDGHDAASENLNDFVENKYVQRIYNQFKRDELYRSRLTETVDEFVELMGEGAIV